MSKGRSATVERFVAFTFAASEIVVEADDSGVIVFAEGALQVHFAAPAASFIGRQVRDLIVPADHDALLSGLSLLCGNTRLAPMLVRLADAQRTPMALAGMALPNPEGGARLCLTFSLPPKPATSRPPVGVVAGLMRTLNLRSRMAAPVSVGLVEAVGRHGAGSALSERALGEVLSAEAPGAVAAELAPGRFGVLGPPGVTLDLMRVVARLERALHGQGEGGTVNAHSLDLAPDGMAPLQVARALRHALGVFAVSGSRGLDAAGLGDGLAGYLHGAGEKAEALRQAIRARRFTMVYQPIVSLGNRRVHHYEALIRPQPVPNCAFSSPQEFILIVETLGLSEELDLAVATAACDAAASSGLSVAFNVSSQSVQSAGFRDALIPLLAASPACKAGLMLVEMTETADVENLAEASLTLEALRGLGVPFCLDDFGAGAADIRLLRALAADILKLDGSYVPGITESGRERAFVGGMVEIARAAGVAVVAERVETEAEAVALQQLGVRYGQGWLFGRPAPIPSKSAWRLRR